MQFLFSCPPETGKKVRITEKLGSEAANAMMASRKLPAIIFITRAPRINPSFSLLPPKKLSLTILTEIRLFNYQQLHLYIIAKVNLGARAIEYCDFDCVRAKEIWCEHASLQIFIN